MKCLACNANYYLKADRSDCLTLCSDAATHPNQYLPTGTGITRCAYCLPNCISCSDGVTCTTC